MSTMTMTNGRPQRKQLSDQLDRLDTIIDALADGLPAAVADASREGTKAAVRDVLMELLANPEILALIRGSAGPAPVPTVPVTPPKPSPIKKAAQKVSSKVKAGARKVGKVTKSAAKSVVLKCSAVWGMVKSAGRVVRDNPRVKKAVIVGAGVGAIATVIAATNHTLATTMSGIGAAATTVAVQAGVWMRATGRRLGLV